MVVCEGYTCTSRCTCRRQLSDWLGKCTNVLPTGGQPPPPTAEQEREPSCLAAFSVLSYTVNTVNTAGKCYNSANPCACPLLSSVLVYVLNECKLQNPRSVLGSFHYIFTQVFLAQISVLSFCMRSKARHDLGVRLQPARGTNVMFQPAVPGSYIRLRGCVPWWALELYSSLYYATNHTKTIIVSCSKKCSGPIVQYPNGMAIRGTGIPSLTKNALNAH